MAKAKVDLKVTNGGCFDDLNIINDGEFDVVKGRELDMFKQVLPAIDRKNYKFFEDLTDKEKKSYAPVVIMRWMSTGNDNNGNHHYLLQNINNFVNVKFWELSKHAELQHKLMCVSSLGNNERHSWIPGIKKGYKKSKIDEFILSFKPGLSPLELQLIKKHTTSAEFEQYISELGLQEADIKKLMTLWKKEKV